MFQETDSGNDGRQSLAHNVKLQKVRMLQL